MTPRILPQPSSAAVAIGPSTERDANFYFENLVSSRLGFFLPKSTQQPIFMKQFLFLSFVAFAMYSCAPVEGCTDPLAVNYDESARRDDGSCIVRGCTSPSASNYDPNANSDDGSCIMTCTCTIDGFEEVAECIDCTGETADAFETACEASDLAAQLVGGSCTLD